MSGHQLSSMDKKIYPTFFHAYYGDKVLAFNIIVRCQHVRDFVSSIDTDNSAKLTILASFLHAKLSLLSIETDTPSSQL